MSAGSVGASADLWDVQAQHYLDLMKLLYITLYIKTYVKVYADIRVYILGFLLINIVQKSGLEATVRHLKYSAVFTFA